MITFELSVTDWCTDVLALTIEKLSLKKFTQEHTDRQNTYREYLLLKN